MNKVKSDFKVFVSDEILDFRTLEEKYSRPSQVNLLQRTQSQDAISLNKPYKDMPVINRKVTPEIIPKPSYNSPTTLIDRCSKYPRLKARSKTVDPRFRKSRPPTDELLTGSQSTVDITNPSMPSQTLPKKKPFSPSHVSSSGIRDLKKPPKCNRDSNTKKTEVESFVTLQHKEAADKVKQENYKYAELGYEQEKYNQYNTESDDEQKIYMEHAATSPELDKYHVNSIGDACNVSSMMGPPEITEDEIIEESESQNFTGDTELEDGSISSPYWDDPRLLENHDVMQPVCSQPLRNPLLTKELAPNGFLVCRNCFSTQWISPEYKYDDRTEICSSLISNDITERESNEKDDSYTLLPYTVLGSVVGILIVSFFAWFVSQQVSWDFSTLWPEKTSTPPQKTTPLVYMKTVGENVVYWMDTLYGKARDIILMPRSDVLNSNPVTEKPSRWWPKYNEL